MCHTGIGLCIPPIGRAKSAQAGEHTHTHTHTRTHTHARAIVTCCNLLANKGNVVKHPAKLDCAEIRGERQAALFLMATASQRNEKNEQSVVPVKQSCTHTRTHTHTHAHTHTLTHSLTHSLTHTIVQHLPRPGNGICPAEGYR